ncbi:conserved hypothetical protein [Burkholderiales bacterium 8X]|nr:conserved hypothetical protein [Burkholderiales bacterium 8X]
MRALILSFNFVFLAVVFSLTSLSGVLLTMVACFGIAALMFTFSTSSKEAGESRTVRRAMGGPSTFSAPLTQF